MPRVLRTRRARQDLIDIWRHVAKDDPSAADAVLGRIDETCKRVSEHPATAPARDDIRPGLRYVVAGPYLVLYRIIGNDIEVMRVVQGRRDLFNL